MGPDGVVVAVNGPAAAAGIAVGMRRRQAEAVCPSVRSLPADPGAEAVAFEPVVRAVEEMIPRVEIAHPGLALVPVTGAVRFYGGEEALLERVTAELHRLTGPGYRIGLAAGPFAAHVAATLATGEAPVHRVADDAAFLRSLDVAVLDSEGLAATFRWLGITTLGQLASLPGQAMLSRFGTEGVEAHRLASGEDRRLAPRQVPADCSVGERFSPPLVNLEQAAFAARALANRLLHHPAMGGAAPHRVVVEAEVAGGTVRTRVWRSADPLDEAALTDRVRWQLRAWLDETVRGDVPDGGEEAGAGPGGLVRLTLRRGDLRRRQAACAPRRRPQRRRGAAVPGAGPGAGGPRPGAPGPAPGREGPPGTGAVAPLGRGGEGAGPGPGGALAGGGAGTRPGPGPARAAGPARGVGRRGDAVAGPARVPLGTGDLLGRPLAPHRPLVGRCPARRPLSDSDVRWSVLM